MHWRHLDFLLLQEQPRHSNKKCAARSEWEREREREERERERGRERKEEAEWLTPTSSTLAGNCNSSLHSSCCKSSSPPLMMSSDLKENAGFLVNVPQQKEVRNKWGKSVVRRKWKSNLPKLENHISFRGKIGGGGVWKLASTFVHLVT